MTRRQRGVIKTERRRPFRREFARMFRRRLYVLGTTGRALAAALGVTEAAVSKWRMGRQVPRLHLENAMFDALHVNLVDRGMWAELLADCRR